MNTDVEIRIPERQINKNEVPKYPKFVFMWWFNYLNGFQLISANRNSLKKKSPNLDKITKNWIPDIEAIEWFAFRES